MDIVDLDVVALKAEQIEPNGDRLLVRRREAAERTKGGLYLPDQSKSPDYLARVYAVGPLVEGFEVGDWVIVGRWVGARFKLLENQDTVTNKEAYGEYLVLSQDDLWGKVINHDGL